jgi:hypothetical protein
MGPVSTAILLTGLLAFAAPSLEAEEYEFVPDTNRYVKVKHGTSDFFIGKLDAEGNFIPDRKYAHLKPGGMLSSVPPMTLINAPAQKGVYEYRSGRLIPGEIDDDGNFIPIAGEKVIDFKEYRYEPKGPRIYNLPGKFVRKGEKEEKK